MQVYSIGLLEEINKSLAVGKNQTGRSISILDIYGFGSLKQHFNRHLFKLEQEVKDSEEKQSLNTHYIIGLRREHNHYITHNQYLFPTF
ncbi:hypothetical protein Leryth_010101 [Lithospermum erythrorhizon]|nr:hypothetical protein Leryth_010101 [Lithospermum erythrorhizon]